MNAEFLYSTHRVVNHKLETCAVHVSRVGGMYQARYEGQADVAFGADEQEAVQRLHKLPNMVRSVCFPKSIDVATERAERAAEKDATPSLKQMRKFNPRGYRS